MEIVFGLLNSELSREGVLVILTQLMVTSLAWKRMAFQSSNAHVLKETFLVTVPLFVCRLCDIAHNVGKSYSK